MDIRELLLRHPGVSIASEKENSEILDFFNRTQIEGRGLQIQYDRSPDFFSFLKLHSPHFLVFVYRGSLGEIQGVGTLILRNGYVDGKVEKVGYLGDLRMGFDRKGALIWRHVYGDLFKHQHEINQLKDVKKFYTCLIEDNRASQLSLATNRKSGFRYHRICPYSMVTLMGQRPFYKMNTSERHVGSFLSLEDILSFYKANEVETSCGYVYSQEIPQRLKTWRNLQVEDFIFVKDQNKVLGACALWSPQHSKKIILSKLPWHLKLIFTLLRIFSLGNFKFDGELKVLYMTHLIFDIHLNEDQKAKALTALIDEAWKRRRKSGYHFLSFCDFDRASLIQATQGYFTHRVSMALHEVQEADALEPNQKNIYGFEMALV